MGFFGFGRKKRLQGPAFAEAERQIKRLYAELELKASVEDRENGISVMTEDFSILGRHVERLDIDYSFYPKNGHTNLTVYVYFGEKQATAENLRLLNEFNRKSSYWMACIETESNIPYLGFAASVSDPVPADIMRHVDWLLRFLPANGNREIFLSLIAPDAPPQETDAGTEE